MNHSETTNKAPRNYLGTVVRDRGHAKDIIDTRLEA